MCYGCLLKNIFAQISSYIKVFNYTNATNDIYMNGDENVIHKYYASFLFSNIHEDVPSES